MCRLHPDIISVWGLLHTTILTFLDFAFGLISRGGLSGPSPPGLESTGEVGGASNLLLLQRGVVCFLILGVLGEFETLAVNFRPLAVFFSTHTTLSYCGDEDTVRARFLGMRDCLGWCERMVDRWDDVIDHFDR